jgi:hypothetical protein
MKTKRSIVVKKQGNPTTAPAHDCCYEQSQAFLNSCRAFQYSIPELRSFLAQSYARVFPSKPYPEEIPMSLVKAAVGYELLVRDYQSKNRTIPEKVVLAHKQALRMQSSAVPPSSLAISLGRSEDCKPIGEATMKSVKNVKTKKAPTPSPETKAAAHVVAKKVVVAKAKKQTVAGMWILLMHEQGNGQKTDQQLAELMTRAFPERTKYTAEDVARHRSIYNNGKFPAQQGKKPAKPAVKKEEGK